jgi:hypothetical protein
MPAIDRSACLPRLRSAPYRDGFDALVASTVDRGHIGAVLELATLPHILIEPMLACSEMGMIFGLGGRLARVAPFLFASAVIFGSALRADMIIKVVVA